MRSEVLVRTGRVELPCSFERWILSPYKELSRQSETHKTAALHPLNRVSERWTSGVDRHKNRHIPTLSLIAELQAQDGAK